jgi:23S rRNA pseudouridine2604 synthase
VEQEEGIRINRFLSEAGVCSRRAADRAIDSGQVRINGNPAEKGTRVMPGDQVEYQGRPVVREEEPILLLLHKPRGIVCTSDPSEPDNIIDYLNYPKRVYTVGRLDKESEGLILLTNQGDLSNKMMRAGNFHEKEYVVTVDRPIDKTFLDEMAAGVYLPELQVKTRPCRIRQLDRYRFQIVLTQGYNRQIRRMCEVFGRQVERLIRIRFMNFTLEGLEPGAWRPASPEEWKTVLELTRDSSNTPGQIRTSVSGNGGQHTSSKRKAGFSQESAQETEYGKK